MAVDYGYWLVGVNGDLLIRIPVGPVIGTDIWTGKTWKAIDPADYGGDPNPWGSKIGNGEATPVAPADLPAGAS